MKHLWKDLAAHEAKRAMLGLPLLTILCTGGPSSEARLFDSANNLMYPSMILMESSTFFWVRFLADVS